MTNQLDDVPHTGGTYYEEGVIPIPAISVSTNDAELLSSMIEEEDIQIFMQANCENLKDKPSYNVIGEIKGSEFPEEIILVGGHLDSWDVGQGAHDDGAGCVQSMDVLQLIKRLDYQPKRTIRCVLFMNEEKTDWRVPALTRKPLITPGNTTWPPLNLIVEVLRPEDLPAMRRDEVFRKKFKTSHPVAPFD